MTVLPNPTPTADGVRVLVDGKQLTFDQQPYIEEGRVMLPMRIIFQELGASVSYKDRKIAIWLRKPSSAEKSLHRHTKDYQKPWPPKFCNLPDQCKALRQCQLPARSTNSAKP